MLQTASVRVRRALRTPIREVAVFRGSKTYSAMMRVRNEAEFLEASVRSILEMVEEVVLVDNMSEDDSPRVIAALAAAEPRVKAFSYPHKVARPGEENRQLLASPEGWSSPRLLANYYNWCMERCTQPFIVKFDGDMVALPHMIEALEAFRSSPNQIMFNTGTNVHQSGTHADGDWPTTSSEPRVFFRRFARYAADFPEYEYLASPYLSSRRVEVDTEPQFLHLVLRKAALPNWGPETHDQARAGTRAGPSNGAPAGRRCASDAGALDDRVTLPTPTNPIAN